MNIQSNKILVYPSSHRSDEYNRSARLNTEENITNFINRLVKNKCFIVNGSGLNGTNLKEGIYNLSGYWFNIKEVDIGSVLANPAADDLLVLKINITEQPIDGSELKFKELSSTDATSGAFPLDLGSSDSKEFKGLAIEKIAKNTVIDENTTLPIAKYKNGNWQMLETARLPFDINQLNISTNSNDHTKIKNDLSKSGVPNNLSLETWLNDYFIIDDGELQ